jgi:hypothetical protein
MIHACATAKGLVLTLGVTMGGFWIGSLDLLHLIHTEFGTTGMH